jgi:HEAT repeat protein
MLLPGLGSKRTGWAFCLLALIWTPPSFGKERNALFVETPDGPPDEWLDEHAFTDALIHGLGLIRQRAHPTLDQLRSAKSFKLRMLSWRSGSASGQQQALLPDRAGWAEPSEEGKGPDPEEIDGIIERMAAERRNFDPRELLELGAPGCRALLSRIFPEAVPGERFSRERALALIAQLGAESYAIREAATQELQERGRPHIHLVRAAAQDDDPEVQIRAALILRGWHREESLLDSSRSRLAEGLEIYFQKLTDKAAQRELAEWVVAALLVRLDTTPKRACLSVCTRALARWPEDSVHHALLPLLEHEDPAVAAFAMKEIAGRTGNSYVAPIHLHALDTGRPELVKAAMRCMPCPIWDRRALPRVRKVLRQIFTGAEGTQELTADADFMISAAFVAARDFRMAKARAYLLDKIAGPDKRIALDAINALGDTYYMRTPVDAELLAALAPHLTSDDPEFRRASVSTLGFYRGPEVVDRLIVALGDSDERVFKEAGQALVNQHMSYGNGESPILAKLRRETERTDDKTTRARIEHVVEFLSRSPRTHRLEW